LLTSSSSSSSSAAAEVASKELSNRHCFRYQLPTTLRHDCVINRLKSSYNAKPFERYILHKLTFIRPSICLTHELSLNDSRYTPPELMGSPQRVRYFLNSVAYRGPIIALRRESSFRQYLISRDIITDY